MQHLSVVICNSMAIYKLNTSTEPYVVLKPGLATSHSRFCYMLFADFNVEIYLVEATYNPG